MSEQGNFEMGFEQACKDVIYLCGCAVNGVVPNEAAVAGMDLDAVFEVAVSHRIVSAVAMALQSAGCEDRRIGQAIAAAQRKDLIFDNALAGVKAGLEEAGIWYMVLKGAVLKELYPKFAMREYADCDILFDASRAEDVQAIMEGLGFMTKSFAHGDHDIYYKLPLLNFEMHRSLFDPKYNEKQFNYYQDVESRLIGDGFEKHFSNEDFYLYVLAHEYKHYTSGGTGLRSVLDAYVYLCAVELDMGYVAAEAEKLGMRDFEEKNRALALHLFGGGELTDDDERMLDYIMRSGAYGTVENQLTNAIHKDGGTKLQYMLKRFSVPFSEKNPNYEAFAEQYPFFYEHKALLPLLPFYRIGRSIKGGWFFTEAKVVKETEREAFPE